MKCQEFNQNLDALVFARLMDAATRDAAQRHTQECARCAGRLRGQRALSTALQITAQAETEEAPARLKADLLAAFAQHHAAPVVTAPAAAVIDLAQVRQARMARRWWLAIAAALAVCVLLGLSARRWQNPVAPQVAQKPASSAPPAPQQETPTVAQQPEAPTVVKASPSKTRQPLVSTQRVAFKAAPRTVPPRPAPRPQPKSAATSQDPTELVTEYIALTYVAAPTAMESGQVVRIAMSRSSAIALGLPAHLEAREDTVKADVVLGDDGLARQIRFVYQPDNSRRTVNR
jgi:hypothetical protein